MANVNVEYEKLTQEAKQLRDGKTEITDKLHHLQTLVNNLVHDGFVTDSASKAFEQSYTEFTTGAQKTIEGLQGLSQFLDKVVETMRQTDESLASAAGH